MWRGVTPVSPRRAPIDSQCLLDRRSEFKADWERNLSGLLPPGAEVEFEHAWERVVDYVTRMAEGLDLDQRNEGPQ